MEERPRVHAQSKPRPTGREARAVPAQRTGPPRESGAVGDTEQLDIARRSGVDPGALSRLLAGTRSPSLETIVALAAAYGGPIEDLLTRPDGTPLRIPAQVVRTAAAVAG